MKLGYEIMANHDTIENYGIFNSKCYAMFSSSRCFKNGTNIVCMVMIFL